jgi:hypothetical protein
MNLKTAHEIGMKIVRALTPACDRIAIAGSVRRGKADPKDAARLVKYLLEASSP